MDAPGEDPPENKRPRMSTRSSKTRAAETTAAMMRDEADIPEPEDTAEYEPEPGMLSSRLSGFVQGTNLVSQTTASSHAQFAGHE